MASTDHLNPVEMWDHLVASALKTATEKASTLTSGKPLISAQCHRLKLREPLPLKDRLLPRIPRSIELIDPQLRASIRVCLAGTAPWPLVVSGPPGSGKTSAGLCLIDHGGRHSLYFTADSFTRTLMAVQEGRGWIMDNGDRRSVNWEVYWQNLQSPTVPIVVLDEIGLRDRVSDAQFNAVKDLLEARFALPLVVLSNIPLTSGSPSSPSIEKLYDSRIVSRLASGTVLNLRGSDRRVQPG